MPRTASSGGASSIICRRAGIIRLAERDEARAARVDGGEFALGVLAREDA